MSNFSKFTHEWHEEFERKQLERKQGQRAGYHRILIVSNENSRIDHAAISLREDFTTNLVARLQRKLDATSLLLALT